MTNREFYTALVELLNAAEGCVEPDATFGIVHVNLDELRTYASEAVTKIDDRNAKRSAKPSKTAIANAPLKDAICAYLATHPNAISADMGVALELSTSKVSSLCTQMANDGLVTVTEVKIKGGRKVKAYTLVE